MTPENGTRVSVARARVLPLRSKCDYINTLCTWYYLSPSLSLSSMDHGYGGRRDPFVIYHERVADSRDTLRATPRLAERTMEIAMDRGKQSCQAVRARAARNRDRVLGPAALS